jgi:hypothetical protein
MDFICECDKLLFVDQRLVPGYGNSPVEHKRDNSWLGGAIAVEDNGTRLLVCYISLGDFHLPCLLSLFVRIMKLFFTKFFKTCVI